MGFIFDGPNKLIILTNTSPFSVLEMYSRWKDWVQLGTNSTFSLAFRSIAGDPIPGGNIDAHVFLDNASGWRIRPYESNHELRITTPGNLWPEDENLPLFESTLGGYTVLVNIRNSASALAVSTSGSSGGLTPEQEAKLDVIYIESLGQVP